MFHQRLRSLLKPRLWLILALATTCTLVSKLPVKHVGFDLIDHFQAYTLLVLILIALLGFFYLNNRLMASIAGGMIIVWLALNLVPLWSVVDFHYQPAIKPIRVMEVNIRYSNHRNEDVRRLIVNESADILALIELTPDTDALLRRDLENTYPWRYVHAVDNPTGIGLYSRYELSAVTVHDFSQLNMGLISGIINIDGMRYNIIVAHPFPPITQQTYLERNQGYDLIATHLPNHELPVIAIGDFNSTLWADDFRKLMKALSVKAYLFAPATWPDIALIPPIGIDHILIPPSMSFVSVKRGPSMGSDHYPLIAEIQP